MIKAFFVDMDGTFLDDRKQYDKHRFHELYQEMKLKGIKFVATSGNQYQYLSRLFLDYAAEFTFIADNGALIVENGTIISQRILEAQQWQAVADFMIKHFPETQLVFSNKDDAYISTRSTETFKKMAQNYFQNINWVQNYQQINDDILKITMLIPDSFHEDLLRRLQIEFHDNIKAITTGYGCVDVINPFIGKEYGVKLLQSRWGLSFDEMAAFGDNMNDLYLLQAVRYGYAMENARADIKAVAYEIIGNNNTSAVLDKIEALMNA